MLSDLSRMIPTSSPAVHEGAVEIKGNGACGKKKWTNEWEDFIKVSEYLA